MDYLDAFEVSRGVKVMGLRDREESSSLLLMLVLHARSPVCRRVANYLWVNCE